MDVDIVLAPIDTGRSDFEMLSEEAIVPICGQAKLAQIASPLDLLEQPSIYVMGFDDHWARYLSAYELKPNRAQGRLVTDTSTAAIEMVASGLGCAVVVERFARQAIDSGQRIAVAGDPVALGHAHFLVKSRARAGLQPHVETFTSWLREQF